MFSLYLLTSNLDDNCYIGITNNIKRRYEQHIKYCKNKRYYNARWINKVIENSGKIDMNIISNNLSEEQAIYFEKLFINIYKAIGLKLTNISEGGKGFSHKGIPHSETHKQNLEKSQPHKIRIPKEILYDLYVNKKLSKKKIGIIYNCGTTSIDRRLNEYNIPIRVTKNYKMSYTLDKNEIFRLYYDEDMSIRQISIKLKVSNNIIRDFLIRNGIKTKRKRKQKIKSYIKYDIDGNFIKSYTIEELCKELNKKEKSIYKYIKTQNICWGYKWEIIYKK